MVQIQVLSIAMTIKSVNAIIHVTLRHSTDQ